MLTQKPGLPNEWVWTPDDKPLSMKGNDDTCRRCGGVVMSLCNACHRCIGTCCHCEETGLDYQLEKTRRLEGL